MEGEIVYTKYDKQIDALLSKMTLKEKIGQLNQLKMPSNREEIEEYKVKIRNGEVGSVILVGCETAGNGPLQGEYFELCNELQKTAVEESPHSIPLIYGLDVIHGHKTVYPIPLAGAAAFNMELIEKCYRCAAKEAAADGVNWTFSPMLDMSRDPRWGRIVESPGEDPYLGAKMAGACIKGFQGDDVADKDSLVACAKHFIGYGASEGGRDYHRTEISDYSLYNYYLPSFKAAVNAGVGTVMSSFNDINGIPVSGSKKYLTDILRNYLGFEGFVVSDWGSVIQIAKQGVAENAEQCAQKAITAGVDMDMADLCYSECLEDLVNSGAVSEAVVDRAVRRILRIKFAKDLFNSPYCEARTVDRTEHLKKAYDIAAESVVLLKNDGVLPLKKEQKISLLGPFINEKRSLLGVWSLNYEIKDVSTFLEAIKNNVNEENIILEADETGLYDSSVLTAAKGDVVVLALGESWKVTGECRCLSEITLSKEQIELIKAVKATGKKVVGVFFCARPIAMEGIGEYLDAIIYAWHNGTRTAEAVSDVLYGKVNPSGKLPATFPRRTGHIPLYYNVTSSGRPVNCYYGENKLISYLDSQSTPYYPFGYGLSYTEFRYSDLKIDTNKLSVSELKSGKKFEISIEVSNIGEYDGKEIVQLYIYDPIAEFMRPLRELKGFKKPFIKQGETVTVSFELGYEDLGYYSDKGEYLLEDGIIYVFIGENCLTDNSIKIEILK